MSFRPLARSGPIKPPVSTSTARSTTIAVGWVGHPAVRGPVESTAESPPQGAITAGPFLNTKPTRPASVNG